MKKQELNQYTSPEVGVINYYLESSVMTGSGNIDDGTNGGNDGDY